MTIRSQHDDHAASDSIGPSIGARRKPATDSEQANALRYTEGPHEGHVESHYIKANSPDGLRALWIKYTVLAPKGAAGGGGAEVWAIAFVRNNASGTPSIVAVKERVPLAELEHGAEPFRLRTKLGELRHGRARGEVRSDRHKLAWDLCYACPGQAFRPFPLASMYTGAFPRTKALTPAPNTRLEGWFEVNGERWDVSDFRAAQGHNWGRTHAQSYAWVHGNAWQGTNGADVFIELLSARVRLGPILTPWLSVGAIAIDDVTYRFDGPRALLSRRVRIDPHSYTLTLRNRSATLEIHVEAEPSLIAGLRYEDPDGSSLFCLNSKLARARLRLSARGREWTLTSEQVALEVGTRRTDHGIAILV